MGSKPVPPIHTTSSDTTKAVDDLLKSLVHPAKREIQALRAVVLEAHPSILEGVKWNAPSFRTSEYFATTNLRTRTGIGVILHFGAKVRDVGAIRESIKDPTKLLKWLANDRATVSFENMGDLEAQKVAFQQLLRQWIEYL